MRFSPCAGRDPSVDCLCARLAETRLLHPHRAIGTRVIETVGGLDHHIMDRMAFWFRPTYAARKTVDLRDDAGR